MAKSLVDVIESLKLEKPIDGGSYYFMTLFADENYKFSHSFKSHWVGFDDKHNEIRVPSLVDPEKTINLFNKIDQFVFVVNSTDNLLFFLFRIGGLALIEKSIAEEILGHMLRQDTFVNTYYDGLQHINDIPKEKFNRAANPKLRMKIFDRDNRRCKICGASPANNEHVELHLHHIKPYGKGGLTEDLNLITLCHTCHKGLEPHTDYSLYSYIGVEFLGNVARGSFPEKLKLNLEAFKHAQDPKLKD